MSDFLIQVVHKDGGQVVSWAPGLSVEKQFIADLCNRVRVKGVGLARTTEHVVTDVKTALEELLRDLKSQV